LNHRQLRFLKRRPSAHLQQLLIPTLVEVAEGSAPEQREPAAAPMLRPVVQHVAALTEGPAAAEQTSAPLVVAVAAGELTPPG